MRVLIVHLKTLTEPCSLSFPSSLSSFISRLENPVRFFIFDKRVILFSFRAFSTSYLVQGENPRGNLFRREKGVYGGLGLVISYCL